ncbi:MAG TPA: PKD-like domain-containing protein [Bacteroidia bacterium]|nr:PKD-like domain-containing protein [Bacteroidia bacterium]
MNHSYIQSGRFKKTKALLLGVGAFLSLQLVAQGQQKTMQYGLGNMSSFANTSKSVSDELLRLTPKEFQNHPEFGLTPVNAPPECIELIQKRTEYSRYYVKKGSNGKEFYLSQAYSPINYKDNQGNLLAIYYKLKPDPTQAGLYTSPNQSRPTKIDVKNQYSSILNNNRELKFNRNLVLSYEDEKGNRSILGKADWSHYHAGDDGVFVTDIFPGIDMSIKVAEGKMKTNFLMKRNVSMTGGFLVIEDELEIPQDLLTETSKGKKNEFGQWVGNIDFKDANQDINYTIYKGVAYDDMSKKGGLANLGYKLLKNKLETYLAVDWLNDASRKFPVTIDPLVSTTGTKSQASITGSSFSNKPWVLPNGCHFTLSMLTPANCTITDVLFQFDFYAYGGCLKANGGEVYSYLGCQSPLAGTGFSWTCPNDGAGGDCFVNAPGNSIFSDIQSCIPAPQCAPYTMTFGMNFFQNYDNTNPNCDPTDIGPYSNWVMTVQGHTVEEPNPPASSGTTTICNGSTTTLTATGQYGVPPYTYSWSPATGLSSTSGNPVSATPPAPTTYTCTITDVCGITATNKVTLSFTGPSVTTASASPSTVCAGTPVNLTSTYGGNATGVTWSGGTGTFTPSANITNPTYNLGPGETSGTVTLTVTTVNPGPCPPASKQVVITINPKPTVSNATTNQVICSGSTTTAVTLTSGTSGTTFTWTATATAGVSGFSTSGTNTIPAQTISTTASTPGTVTYTVTPTAGPCSGPPTNFTVTVNPMPTITNSPLTQSTCSGGTTTAVTLTSAATGATFTWTATATAGISGFTASGTNTIPAQVITTTGTSPGTVTYAITATANGCTATANYVITVNPSLAVTNTPLAQSVCSGGTSTAVVLTANINGATFSWTASATPGITGYTPSGTSTIPAQTLTITGTNPGTVTYNITASANGCTSNGTTNFVITVNPIPTLSNASTQQTICSGGTTAAVTFTSNTSGTTYTWTATGSPTASGYTTSGTNTIPPQTITNSGTVTDTVIYAVTPTANGCSAASPSNYLVIVNPIPTLSNPSTSQAICSGASTSLVTLTSSTAGTSFTWTATGSPSASGYVTSGTNTIPVQTITNSGTAPDTVFYSVTMTANGCVAAKPTVYTVIINPVPTLSNASSSQTICSGGSTTAVTLTSAVAGISFSWTATATPGATGYATSGTNTIPVQTITNPGTTADTVFYSVTLSANGCVAPAPSVYMVIVNPVPTLNMASTSQTICSGSGTSAVTLTSGVAGTTFTWTATGSPTASGYATNGTNTIPVQAITNSGTTVDTVVYHVTMTAAGCTNTSPANYLVFVNPIPKLSNPSTSQTICSGASTTAVNLTSGVSGTTFSWTATSVPSASGYATSGTNTIPVQTITNSSTVADTVFYSVTMTANGCSAGSPSIYMVIVNPITPSPISASPAAYCSGDPIASLTATGPNIKWYSDAALTNLVGTGSPFNPNVTSTTTFYVTETVNGCQSGAATTVTITVNPKPSAGFTATPNRGIAPLNVSFTTTGGTATYAWVFGNGSSGMGSNTSTVYPLKGSYTVVCTATANGCTDSASVVIVVDENYSLIIPNVFTPNDDGVNDVFKVTGTGLTDFSMDIYDRWGIKLFSSTLLNEGWAGHTASGGNATAGTYFYVIKAKETFSGEVKAYQGALLLNR